MVRSFRVMGLSLAILGLVAVGSLTLASASDTKHACTHCLSQKNACCPGVNRPAQAEEDSTSHACPHCASQKHACCPEPK